MSDYFEGALVRISCEIKDFDEVLIDPSQLFLTVIKPDKTETEYEYGVDPEIIRDDLGKYHADIPADLAGHWCYNWNSTGDGQASHSDNFYVNKKYCF
jgi:hypothetical protein